MPIDKVCLGVIVGAHGIRGEVKVKSFTQNPVDIKNYRVFENDDGSEKFNLKFGSFAGKNIKASVEGITDRNQAEEIKGQKLFIERDLLEELEEDDFYHADLIGLDANLEDDKTTIGKVTGVYNYGAGDFLEIKAQNDKPATVPFTKEAVPVVDIKSRYILVKKDFVVFEESKKTKEHEKS